MLFTRPTVHELTSGGSMASGALLRNLQDAGFRKVAFSDKYQSSWTYDLEPEDDSDSGRLVLEEFGLHQPLALPVPE